MGQTVNPIFGSCAIAATMIAICIHVLLISAQRPRKPKEGAQDCVIVTP